MKKITLSLAFIAFGFVANAQMSSDATLTSNQVSNQSVSEMGTGTIIEVTQAGGRLLEEGTGASLEFINPRIPNVVVGERFSFFKIIQSTPQGEKVIIILKTKLP